MDALMLNLKVSEGHFQDYTQLNACEMLVDRFSRAEISIPSLPNVALKARQIASDSAKTVKDLSEIIIQDPSLSGYLIRVVNSPLYRRGLEINTVPEAVSRMGMQTASSLILALTLRQMYRSSSQAIQSELESLWENSVKVSAIAALLAAESKAVNKDEAMLAGLLVYIGALPVTAGMESLPRSWDNPELIREVIEKLHSQVTQIVLIHWNMPLLISKAVVAGVNEDAEPSDNLERIIRLAVNLSKRGVDTEAQDEARYLGVSALEEIMQGDTLKAMIQALR